VTNNMSETSSGKLVTANEAIQHHSQVCSCIEIFDLPGMVEEEDVSTFQVFLERVAQEIYNTRKKNYSWGFRVIEPEFINFAERIVLVSKLYKEEDLQDLNSVVFKLFTEFNNIILSTALHMHLPIRGSIQVGDTYRGMLKSRKPALVPGKDPLILSDLLKVFSIGEIFPNGFSDGLIPAVDMPYHFGKGLCNTSREISPVESIGIFMDPEFNDDHVADVTILSNMMIKAEVNGKTQLVCNWKEWMREHTDCDIDNIIAFASSEESRHSDHGKKWQSLVEYSAHL
jgi:hypothetical protein